MWATEGQSCQRQCQSWRPTSREWKKYLSAVFIDSRESMSKDKALVAIQNSSYKASLCGGGRWEWRVQEREWAG